MALSSECTLSTVVGVSQPSGRSRSAASGMVTPVAWRILPTLGVTRAGLHTAVLKTCLGLPNTKRTLGWETRGLGAGVARAWPVQSVFSVGALLVGTWTVEDLIGFGTFKIK